MRLARIATYCLQVAVLSGSLQAQTAGAQDVSKTPSAFVQQFYDWYTPKALGDNAGPAWELAMRQKRSSFSPQLAHELKEDSAAQSKSHGEVVGLDFDPFLNSQDPLDHYEVGDVVRSGKSYLVNIHGVQSGKKDEKPDVVAELIEKDGHWVFVNFHYPEHKDLITLLRSLRSSRHKASH